MFQYFILLPLETFEKFQCKTLQSEKVVKSSRMSTVSPKVIVNVDEKEFTCRKGEQDLQKIERVKKKEERKEKLY